MDVSGEQQVFAIENSKINCCKFDFIGVLEHKDMCSSFCPSPLI